MASRQPAATTMKRPIRVNCDPKFVRDLSNTVLEKRRKEGRFVFVVRDAGCRNKFVESQGLVAGLFCEASAPILQQLTQDPVSSKDFVDHLLKHMDWLCGLASPWLSGSDFFLWSYQEACQRVWSGDKKVEIVIVALQRLYSTAQTNYNTVYYAEELLRLPEVQRHSYYRTLYRNCANVSTELLLYHRIPQDAIVGRVPIHNISLRTLLGDVPFRFLDTIGDKLAVAGQRTKPDTIRYVEGDRNCNRTAFRTVLRTLQDRVFEGRKSLPPVVVGVYVAELAISCLYDSWNSRKSRTPEMIDGTQRLASALKCQLYNVRKSQAAQVKLGIERRLAGLEASLQNHGEWLPVEVTVDGLTDGITLPDKMKEKVARVMQEWRKRHPGLEADLSAAVAGLSIAAN